MEFLSGFCFGVAATWFSVLLWIWLPAKITERKNARAELMQAALDGDARRRELCPDRWSRKETDYGMHEWVDPADRAMLDGIQARAEAERYQREERRGV